MSCTPVYKATSRRAALSTALSATECAIRAGYSRTSAYQRAHELLNPKTNPATAQIIHDRLMGNMEVWNLNKEKHMANLCRIQEAAKEKGQ